MQAAPCPRSVRYRAYATALACSFMMTLAACHEAPPPLPPPSPSPPAHTVSPAWAVATSLRLIAAGDFNALMQHRLPPADYARWRAEWKAARAHPVPVSAVQQRQFAKLMAKLTEPGAEQKLARQLHADLARRRDKKKAARMPILTDILQAAGQRAIAGSPQLDPVQKALALQGLGALGAWAETTDLGNREKIRKAIGLASATVRRLHVHTLAQWHALDYATTMKNYQILWQGLEQVLEVYGLDVKRSLLDASVSATVGDRTHATVKIDLTLAGQPLTGKWPMVKVAGHWYDAALLTAWNKAHPATTASIAPSAQGHAARVASPGAAGTAPPPRTPATTRPDPRQPVATHP